MNEAEARNREIGGRLRQIRLARRISQADLAEQVGVSQSVVSRWEAGARPLEVGHVELVAQALEVPALEIVVGRATPPADEQNLGAELRWWGLDVLSARTEPLWVVRTVEEVTAEALVSPDPRIVDRLAALFFLHPRMRPGVLWGYAESRGVQQRLGWLIDVAREVVAHGRGQQTDVLRDPRPDRWLQVERGRWAWDDMGSPAEDRSGLGPIWQRWKIGYDRRLVDLIAVILQTMGDWRES